MDVFQKVGEIEITEKTKANLVRKSTFVDIVDFDEDGIPKPSWIDISITELCNRKCVFCPRAESDVYPNQNLHFSKNLARKLASELENMNYQGGVVFCGYGEPLLHPEISKIVKSFEKVHLEIVTNGDRLNSEMVEMLFQNGLDFLCVSLYDGPEQIEKMEKIFTKVGIEKDKYILRDRWHQETDSFGLKLTNRTGVINFGPDSKEYQGHPCYYTAYSLAIDWNGDVLMCVQDWSKKVKFGNVNETSIAEVWKSLALHKVRKRLICGKRDRAPCNNCNADGTLHGFNHVNAWERVE